METIFYYKTASDIWHFSTGVSKEATKAVQYKRMLEKMRKQVVRLYLNVPEHFELIKANYRTPDYWARRTWQEEYEEQN